MVALLDPKSPTQVPQTGEPWSEPAIQPVIQPGIRSVIKPVLASRRTAVGLILGAPLLSACAGVQQSLNQFSNPFASPAPSAGPAGPAQQPQAIGNGQVRVGLILPMSASGNAGVAAQSMKNAAEMALAEFQNPNIQLLIKDDGGSIRRIPAGTGRRRRGARIGIRSARTHAHFIRLQHENSGRRPAADRTRGGGGGGKARLMPGGAAAGGEPDAA